MNQACTLGSPSRALVRQRRQHIKKLTRRAQSRHLIDRDECGISLPDHIGQRASRLPRIEQVPHPRQRIAASLQLRDQTRSRHVPGAVNANSPPPLRRRQQTRRLVLADRPRRNTRSTRELIDRHPVVH
jgi:hypothetical protein